jgi:lipoprotein-anchoring transpeptidase ErfK/SrfK
MQRSVLLIVATLSGATLMSSPASSQSNMGGGFVEFLFGGQNVRQQRYNAQPAYPGSPVEPDSQGGSSYRSGSFQDQQAPYGNSQARIDPRFYKQVVSYSGSERPGTIIVDTPQRYLFLVQEDGKAIRYGIGVGRPGFAWAGAKSITRKAEWPDWVPPKEMLARRPDLPHFMAGGPDNPLGARALYLGSSLYRIHGSNEPWTIGQAVSSGCIRMRNEDVTDLYERVKVGTRVVVI